MKIFSGLIIVLVGALLLSAIEDFPKWGNPYAPANREVASYYLEHAYEETHVPNIVTAVLADYRAFDTMFETAVVFVAGIGIMTILRRRKRKDEKGQRKEERGKRKGPRRTHTCSR